MNPKIKSTFVFQIILEKDYTLSSSLKNIANSMIKKSLNHSLNRGGKKMTLIQININNF
jgi:hypothetical protein